MHLPSCCGTKIFVLLILVSVSLLVVSLVLTFQIFPQLILSEVNKNVRLEENTEQFDRFLKLPFPVDFKVYIFNVENPENVTAGEKPILREIGPYVYKQYREKTIQEVDEDEDSISYTQSLRFEFNSEASGDLSDTDEVSVLNVALMGILQTAEDMSLAGVIADCIKASFEKHPNIFIKIKVKELLFDGITLCSKNQTFACSLLNVIPCDMAAKKRNIDTLEDGSLNFSYFNYKARSPDGVYTVLRGIKDISTLGHIIRLDNSNYTSYWSGNDSNAYCDEVKGSDSTLYPPEITHESIFQIYSTDICRYIEIYYIEKGTYRGINGYIFSPNNSTLTPTTSIPKDDCFCSNKTSGVDGQKSCFLDGVLDLQPCIGVPVLLSFPHFLWADESYLDGVEGLQPNEDIHKIFLMVEPNTGTPLQGMKRIQMNSVIRPVQNVKYTESLPNVVLPLLWVEEGVSLTDEYIKKLEDMYFAKVTLVDYVQWGLIGATSILTLIFSTIVINKMFCRT